MKGRGRTPSNSRLGESEGDEATATAAVRSRSTSSSSTGSCESKEAIVRVSRKDKKRADSVASRTRSNSATSKADTSAQRDLEVIEVSDAGSLIQAQSSSNLEEPEKNDGARSDTGSARGSQTSKRSRSREGDLPPPIEEKKKRGPGRPVTTGDYERKKIRDAERLAQKEKENEKEMLDPSKTLEVSKTEAKLRSEAELADEYKVRPTPDLAAEALDAATVIRSLATKSGHLKGSLQKELRERTNSIMAVMTVLAARAQSNPDRQKEAMEELRKDLASLRYENERLRGEVSHLRNMMERREQVRAPDRIEVEEDPPRNAEDKRGGGDVDRATPASPTVTTMQLRSKGKGVSYVESGSDGEGEMVEGPSLAPEPIPLPQRTPRRREDKKTKGGGHHAKILPRNPPLHPRTKEWMLIERERQRKGRRSVGWILGGKKPLN